MASLALHLKNHHHKTLLQKSTSNLTFSHLFSSSSSSDDNSGNNSPKSSGFASYFSDIKSRLKHEEDQQKQQQQQQSSGSSPFRFTPQGSPNASKVGSLDEIRKNLSQFRRGSTDSPPVASQQPTLFQNLYKKEDPNAKPIGENVVKGEVTFEKIRESLRQLRESQGDKKSNQPPNEPSLNKYKENFRLGPRVANRGSVIGGSPEGLPVHIFGREMRENEKKGENKEDPKVNEMREIEFRRPYSQDELGKRLRELRPEVAKKTEKGGEENWFSLAELNERLKKLKESENQANAGRLSLGDLRMGLEQLEPKNHDRGSRQAQRFEAFGRISGMKDFTLSPPKEHLIEKYFHPDNMSSAEKLKIELKKVRDEFKMHESDCGSARVQIAILSTEISHLSSVLHKKDKHSRRGLLAKVQQRKKLLKYLRRTDWDSYCFVLSRLGLRDNPDYKH